MKAKTKNKAKRVGMGVAGTGLIAMPGNAGRAFGYVNMYHGTVRQNAWKIIEEGFDASHANKTHPLGNNTTSYNNGKVFLGTKRVAKRYARSASAEHPGLPKVLKVQLGYNDYRNKVFLDQFDAKDVREGRMPRTMYRGSKYVEGNLSPKHIVGEVKTGLNANQKNSMHVRRLRNSARRMENIKRLPSYYSKYFARGALGLAVPLAGAALIRGAIKAKKD